MEISNISSLSMMLADMFYHIKEVAISECYQEWLLNMVK